MGEWRGRLWHPEGRNTVNEEGLAMGNNTDRMICAQYYRAITWWGGVNGGRWGLQREWDMVAVDSRNVPASSTFEVGDQWALSASGGGEGVPENMRVARAHCEGEYDPLIRCLV